MRNEVAASPQVRVKRGHVKRALAFVLEFAMLHRRALAQDQLHNRIGEISRLAGAGIAFENGRLAALLGHDQVARMRGRAGFLPGRDE